MKLSIIIPTKDRGEVFEQTLRCAASAIRHLDAEIIIVNDSKISEPHIPAGVQKVKLVNNPRQGVASARNMGVKESDGELLLFIDDDIMISKDSVDHVLALHSQYSHSCFNVNWEYPIEMQKSITKTQFGRFMKAHRLTCFKGWYSEASWKDNALFRSKSVASFHLSLSRSDFEKTRGYNEQFPHAGFEDHDFPAKLREAGLAFYIDSRVTVFHNEIDRMTLANWLKSQESRAETRHVAVKLGFEELTLEYGVFKRIFFTLVLFSQGLLLRSLQIIPNHKIFDPLYFKLTAVLQAARIYKGYTS